MSREAARRNLAGLVPDEPHIPSIDRLDEAMLPASIPVYEQPLSTAVVEYAERSDKLTHLVDKAFDTLDECLDLNDSDADYVRMMSLRKDTALGVLNTQAKVDDTSLRRRQVDMLPKLLEIIAREEKRLPEKVIEASAF